MHDADIWGTVHGCVLVGFSVLSKTLEVPEASILLYLAS